MISIMHADPAVPTDDDILIPAGGRRMEMDSECVVRAFDGAAAALGWDVDIRVTPERQHALILFSEEQIDLLVRTTSEFYQLVEEAIGVEQFMSIWIDFGSRSLYAA